VRSPQFRVRNWDRLYENNRSREEARRILRFSTSKLDAETRSGRLEVHRLGRLVRIKATDLDEYVRQGRKEAGAELAP